MATMNLTITTLITDSGMKQKVYKVGRSRAVEIAMNHNCVSREVAERYTDSELREVLRCLKLKANF